jgi:hypothetical protein
LGLKPYWPRAAHSSDARRARNLLGGAGLLGLTPYAYLPFAGRYAGFHPYTLHSTPFTPHTTPYTLHPTRYTLHPALLILVLPSRSAPQVSKAPHPVPALPSQARLSPRQNLGRCFQMSNSLKAHCFKSQSASPRTLRKPITPSNTLAGCRCRANMAQIRQSRPDYGCGLSQFKAKVVNFL